MSAIEKTRMTPIITEVKFASPSAGKIRERENPVSIAKAMLAGGACALSILTDPDNFQGGLDVLAQVAGNFDTPIVMKDILVSTAQLRAGAQAGADAVVLISEVFTRGLAETTPDGMMRYARNIGLEVLVEANSAKEFERIRKFDPDLYGVNNRDLSTFQLELSTTEKILSQVGSPDRLVVSESGIESASDIIRLKRAGAEAFLVGTSIMKSPNIERKVREFASA